MYEAYLITNQISGKKYVGITKRGYMKRFQEHIRYATKSNRHSLLYEDIRKFGVESFTVSLLEDNISEDEALLRFSKQTQEADASKAADIVINNYPPYDLEDEINKII